MTDPTKQEIAQVFKRLRAVGPNKVCAYVPRYSVEIYLLVWGALIGTTSHIFTSIGAMFVNVYRAVLFCIYVFNDY